MTFKPKLSTGTHSQKSPLSFSKELSIVAFQSKYTRALTFQNTCVPAPPPKKKCVPRRKMKTARQAQESTEFVDDVDDKARAKTAGPRKLCHFSIEYVLVQNVLSCRMFSLIEYVVW